MANDVSFALAPSSQLTKSEFLERFKAASFLLSHEAANEYIKEQIKKEIKILGGREEWQARKTMRWDTRLGGAGNKLKSLGIFPAIRIVSVTGLLRHTGQFAHVGLSGKDYDGIPVLYIDSQFYNEAYEPFKAVPLHEADEIAQWENLRRSVLSKVYDREIKRDEMRKWIKDHINSPDEKLSGTPYAGLNSRQIAKKFHDDSYPLTALYAEYVGKIDFNYEYINTMLSLYGSDEDSGDVNIAAKRDPIDEAFCSHVEGFKGEAKEHIESWGRLLNTVKPGIRERLLKGNILIGGPGRHMHEIEAALKMFPEARQITVMDGVKDNLIWIKQELKKKYPKERARIKFVNKHLPFTGFSTGSFDIVIYNSVIDGALIDGLFLIFEKEDECRILSDWTKEIRRVLKPGGVYLTERSEMKYFIKLGFAIPLAHREGGGKIGCSQFLAAKSRNTINAGRRSFAGRGSLSREDSLYIRNFINNLRFSELSPDRVEWLVKNKFGAFRIEEAYEEAISYLYIDEHETKLVLRAIYAFLRRWLSLPKEAHQRKRIQYIIGMVSKSISELDRWQKWNYRDELRRIKTMLKRGKKLLAKIPADTPPVDLSVKILKNSPVPVGGTIYNHWNMLPMKDAPHAVLQAAKVRKRSTPLEERVKEWKKLDPVFPIAKEDLPADFARLSFPKGTSYGSRWDWVGKNVYYEGDYYHAGVDIAFYITTNGKKKRIPIGTTIRAPISGRVVHITPNEGIVIEAVEKGKLVFLFHMLPGVKEGQSVKQNEKVGILSKVPRQPIAHLHLGLVNSKYSVPEFVPQRDPLQERYIHDFLGWQKLNHAIDYIGKLEKLYSFNPAILWPQLLITSNNTRDNTLVEFASTGREPYVYVPAPVGPAAPSDLLIALVGTQGSAHREKMLLKMKDAPRAASQAAEAKMSSNPIYDRAKEIAVLKELIFNANSGRDIHITISEMLAGELKAGRMSVDQVADALREIAMSPGSNLRNPAELGIDETCCEIARSRYLPQDVWPSFKKRLEAFKYEIIEQGRGMPRYSIKHIVLSAKRQITAHFPRCKVKSLHWRQGKVFNSLLRDIYNYMPNLDLELFVWSSQRNEYVPAISFLEMQLVAIQDGKPVDFLIKGRCKEYILEKVLDLIEFALKDDITIGVFNHLLGEKQPKEHKPATTKFYTKLGFIVRDVTPHASNVDTRVKINRDTTPAGGADHVYTRGVDDLKPRATATAAEKLAEYKRALEGQGFETMLCVPTSDTVEERQKKARVASEKAEAAGRACGFREYDQLLTIRNTAHEITLNIFEFGTAGVFGVKSNRAGLKRKIEMVFWDVGKGIKNPEKIRQESLKKQLPDGDAEEPEGCGFADLNLVSRVMLESGGKCWVKKRLQPFVYNGKSDVKIGTRISVVVEDKQSVEATAPRATSQAAENAQASSGKTIPQSVIDYIKRYYEGIKVLADIQDEALDSETRALFPNQKFSEEPIRAMFLQLSIGQSSEWWCMCILDSKDNIIGSVWFYRDKKSDNNRFIASRINVIHDWIGQKVMQRAITLLLLKYDKPLTMVSSMTRSPGGNNFFENLKLDQRLTVKEYPDGEDTRYEVQKAAALSASIEKPARPDLFVGILPKGKDPVSVGGTDHVYWNMLPMKAAPRAVSQAAEEIPFIDVARGLTEEVPVSTDQRRATLHITKEILPLISSRDMDAIMKAITTNVVSEEDGRSIRIDLKDPIILNGGASYYDRIEALWVKGVIFDASKNVPVYEGRGALNHMHVTDRSGLIHDHDYEGNPHGANRLAKAVNEFVKSSDVSKSAAFGGKLVVKIPVGWGEIFPAEPFIDNFGKPARLGFVILGASKEFFHRETLPDQDVGETLSSLHDNGFCGYFLHGGNTSSYIYKTREESSLAYLRSAIHDLDILKGPRDNLTKEEALAWKLFDFFYAAQKLINSVKLSFGAIDEEEEVSRGFIWGYFGNDLAPSFFQNCKRLKHSEIMALLKSADKTPVQNMDHPLIIALKRKMERAGQADWGLGEYKEPVSVKTGLALSVEPAPPGIAPVSGTYHEHWQTLSDLKPPAEPDSAAEIEVSAPDIEHLRSMVNKLIPDYDKQSGAKYYTVRYNTTKIPQGSAAEKLLKLYVEEKLAMNLDGDNRIKLERSIASDKGLIWVECYKDRTESEAAKIGECHVNIDEDITGKAMRLIGMLNMAFIASHLPKGMNAEDAAKYENLISFVRAQYKDMTNEELPEDVFKNIAGGIWIRLPRAAPIPLDKVEEYYRLTIERLEQAV